MTEEIRSYGKKAAIHTIILTNNKTQLGTVRELNIVRPTSLIKLDTNLIKARKSK